MMLCQERHVFLLADADQVYAEQRPSHQVEWPFRFFSDQPHHFRPTLFIRQFAQVGYRQRERLRGPDNLLRLSVTCKIVVRSTSCRRTISLRARSRASTFSTPLTWMADGIL